MSLTKGQQAVLDEAKKGSNIFITGGGGVGKSYIINRIVSELQDSGKTVLITASTGKAAALIGGVTCHRTFHIPIKVTWLAEPEIHEDSPLYESDVILIDEVSMLRIDAFEYIIKSVEEVNRIRTTDEYLKNPENTHRSPIQIIVIGDFCQLPPVIAHPTDGSPDEGDLMSEYYNFDIGQVYAFYAPGWNRSRFVTCELTEVMRQSDKDMIDALNRIRYGDRSALVYFSTHKRKKKFSKGEDVVYLCGKNTTADRINGSALSKLPGKEYKFRAKCDGQVSKQDKQAPDEIKLKVGAHVIMLQNSTKYRNGSSGTITAAYEDSVSVRIHETGEEVEIPYTTWDIERYVIKEDDTGKKKVEKEKIGSYSQLPLRLGYAITIHKSQGQTFDKAVLCLGSDDKKKGAKSTRPEIFAYGQLYVGLSRVKSMDGLYIEGNLDLIDKLAAPEVMRFYEVSKVSDAAQSTKTRRVVAKTPRKTAKKKSSKAGREEAVPHPDLKVLHCTKENVSIVWIFAQTLAPDSVLSGTDIYITEKYRDVAERFIAELV